jgi:hypothetical protein
VLEYEADAFFAQARYLSAIGNLQVARARLDNTVGRKALEPEPAPAAAPAAPDAAAGAAPQAEAEPPETDSPAEVSADAEDAPACPSQTAGQIRNASAVLFPLHMRCPELRPTPAPMPPPTATDSAPPTAAPTAEILIEAAPAGSRPAPPAAPVHLAPPAPAEERVKPSLDTPQPAGISTAGVVPIGQRQLAWSRP